MGEVTQGKDLSVWSLLSVCVCPWPMALGNFPNASPWFIQEGWLHFLDSVILRSRPPLNWIREETPIRMMVGQELCHYLGTVGMGQVGHSPCVLPSINTNWDHFEYGKPLFADHLLVFICPLYTSSQCDKIKLIRLTGLSKSGIPNEVQWTNTRLPVTLNSRKRVAPTNKVLPRGHQRKKQRSHFFREEFPKGIPLPEKHCRYKNKSSTSFAYCYTNTGKKNVSRESL